MPRVVKIEGMEMRNGLSDPDSGQTEGGVGVLQRPETSRQEPGDKDRYAHYVSAHRLATSRLTGQPVVALCGKVWVPTREVQNHPICPRCVEIKKEMDASGGPDWPFRGPGSR